MSPAARQVRIPSLVKKYLMALSGLVLVLFVLGHMAGNLLFFVGPEAINAYAHQLHNMPGNPVTLWLIRLVLLGALGLHVWMAVLLTLENKRARGPDAYLNKKSEVSSYAARTMPISGVVLLAFIVLHILQFTTRVVPVNYEETIGQSMIEVGYVPVATFDVYAMMVDGFSDPLFALIYVVAVALLCLHLTHGVTSMFQTMGLRNESWRKPLCRFALAYGWIIFIGFASIPTSVMVFGTGKAYLAEKQEVWSAATPEAPQSNLLATTH